MCGAFLSALACAPQGAPAALSGTSAHCEPVASDSADARVFLTLRPSGAYAQPAPRASARERRMLALALHAVQTAMAPPDRALATTGTIALYRGPAVPGTDPVPLRRDFTLESWDVRSPGRGVLAPRLRVGAVLHADGRLTSIARTTSPSVMPGLDRAIVEAVARVGAARSLVGLLAELTPIAGTWPASDGGAGALRDSMRLSFDVDVEPDTLLGSLPLLELRLPVYDGVALPIADPRNPPPRYPTDARFLGEDGQVIVEFVVTPAGRADPHTLHVLHATSDDFADAVARVIPRYRFQPAVIGDCALPMAVSMPFKFQVAR